MPTSRETCLRPIGTSLGAIIPVQAVRQAGIHSGERLHVRARRGEIVLARDLSDPAAREALRVLRPFLGGHIRAVVLFGSYLTRRYRPGKSDIDLFLLARGGLSLKTESEIYKALDRSRFPFEPVLLTRDRAEGFSIMDDVRRGYLLYGTL